MSDIKEQFFHYGICTILNHPKVNGNWDLWAVRQGPNKVVLERRVLDPAHIDIKAQYRLNFDRGIITHQAAGDSHARLIAMRERSSNREIYVRWRLVPDGPAGI